MKMKDSLTTTPTVTHEGQQVDSAPAMTPVSLPITTRPARLSVAERAFVRGMVALRDQNYSEAFRQLSGYLKLTENKNRRAALVCEVLALHLAIGREIAIIEPKVG